jgi:hypothetical protein
VSVREDCRHYLKRTTQGGELMQRCRLGAAEEPPFACPEGCLFFEERALSRAGWAKEAGQPMSNTAWGLASSSRPESGKGGAPRGGGSGGAPRGGATASRNKRRGRKGH